MICVVSSIRMMGAERGNQVVGVEGFCFDCRLLQCVYPLPLVDEVM